MQIGSLELQGALLNKPLKNENIVIPLNVMRLIKLNKQKSEICETLNLLEDQFLAAVQRLVENGHQISKNSIQMLCDIETVDFDQLQSNISEDTLHSGLLSNAPLIAIQLDYQQSTEVNLPLEFIRLMVSYYRVRDHLNRSKISYFDFDDQSLNNATKLIADERYIPNQNYQENVPPYLRRAIISYFYDDCDFDDYYNGWEENEVDSDRESDNHDTDNELEEEEEENADDESDGENSNDESDEENSDDSGQSIQCTNADNSSSNKDTSSKRHSESLGDEKDSPKRRRS